MAAMDSIGISTFVDALTSRFLIQISFPQKCFQLQSNYHQLLVANYVLSQLVQPSLLRAALVSNELHLVIARQTNHRLLAPSLDRVHLIASLVGGRKVSSLD